MKLLISKQILLLFSLGNVLRTVWRICILILGLKGLKTQLKVSLEIFEITIWKDLRDMK